MILSFAGAVQSRRNLDLCPGMIFLICDFFLSSFILDYRLYEKQKMRMTRLL